MDYQKAIEILHPDTTAKKLAEIEYLGGFSGREKKIEAVNEACIVACEAMKELQQYKALGTLEEVRAAVEKHMEIAPKVLVSSQDTKIGNVIWGKGTKIYKCGCCKSFMFRSSKYCHECGQAIDWSVSE